LASATYRCHAAGASTKLVSAAAPRIEADFDLASFLARPLVARVAAAGPSVRAVWFLWEEGAFWWLTGDWSRLPSILKADPRVALGSTRAASRAGRCSS
jgi:hypothetical protein